MQKAPNIFSMLINLAKAGDIADIAAIAALYFRRKCYPGTYRPKIVTQEAPAGGVLHFELPESPLVSIIIPAHNQWAATRSCLRSLSGSTGTIPCEVILADDASTDETSRCENLVTGIRVVRNRENLGFLRTCNRAALAASGTYLLLLNNDTHVQEGWLKSLLELFERDGDVGLAGPKLVYPDGRLQEAGGIVWNDGSAWNHGKWDDPDRAQYNYVREADYISGACILIRKSLWEEIGGFDDRYVPAYCEDADLAFEVRKRGFRVIYQPQSVVVHFEGASCGTDTNRGIKRYQMINREKFFKKWESVLSNQHFSPGQLRFAIKERYGT